MFSKKKHKTEIDPEQLQLIENAQRRVKQKKRLYIHFVLFLIGSVLLIVLNVLLGVGNTFKPFGIDWFVYVVGIWFLLFLYHIFNVFFINKFLGKEWEQQQMEKLVSKQKERIDQLKSTLKKEDLHLAESNAYNESLKKKNQELTIIVAAGENDSIGKDNQLIWHLKDDLQRFKKLTSGHHIIMGRKTFETFPKPLPNRTHIVITRQKDYSVPDGVLLVDNLEKAIELSKNDNQPFIIGGGEIYKQAMDVADKIELTRVHEHFDADTFFPEIDTTIWKETNTIFHKKDKDNEYEFSFITYVRR